MIWNKEPEWSESNVSTWECRHGKPSNTLKDWVYSYSDYREEVGRPVRRLEVPREHVILILEFGTCLQISSVGSRLEPSKYEAFVVGLNKEPLIAEHDGVQRCLEVELLPWAVERLFGMAATEFTQGVVPLEDIWGNNARVLIEQLSEISSWQERFALLERVLSEELATSSSIVQPEIQWAWSQLEHYGGCIQIRQLAKTIGWSDRYFATRFREQIGIAPKAAARRIRFNRAHQLLKDSEHPALSEIAAICGYSDQSHFAREFRQFSGCSPAVYRKARFPDLLGTSGDIIH